MSIPGAEDTIDPATFEQILEMDEDEVDREFSKSIVFDFFGQADSTFAKMDSSLWVPRITTQCARSQQSANATQGKARSRLPQDA